MPFPLDSRVNYDKNSNNNDENGSDNGNGSGNCNGNGDVDLGDYSDDDVDGVGCVIVGYLLSFLSVI